MPVPSQGHYGFHCFPVVDWFCLFIYLWVLTFPLLDYSEFGNFVISLNENERKKWLPFDVLKNPNTVKFYDLFSNVNYDVKIKIAKFCKIILSVVN
jgi:hypothetical protein